MTDEDERVNTILEVLTDLDPEIARRFLREHHGNVDNALNALLTEGTGDGAAGLGLDTGPPPLIVPPTSPLHKSRSLEDLTQGDSELKEAIRLSLETGDASERPASPSALKLRPSDREPTQDWAMTTVPSQAPAGVSSEDEMMQRALQASMASQHHDDFIPKSAFERMRTDDRIIAFRASDPGLQWAAMVLQVICALPHVWRALSEWGKNIPPSILEHPYCEDPDETACLLLQLCILLKKSCVHEYIIDDFLAKLRINPLGPGVAPGDASQELYGRLTTRIETLLLKQSLKQDKLRRIFALRHGSARVLPLPEDEEAVFDPQQDTTVVEVTLSPDRGEGLELLGELEKLMTQTADGARVISAASDVIAFRITRNDVLPSYSPAASAGSDTNKTHERTPFRYPASLYLDQFLRENYEKTQQHREARRTTLEKVVELEDRKRKLMHHKGRNALQDLRGSLYYLEKVADRSDSTRAAVVDQSAEKLRKIISHIEGEITSIEQEVVKLKDDASKALLGGPDMQKHRYDLRAMLVHDGQIGRKHLISYIRIGNQCHRTIDDEATKIPTLPLNDNTGLHYNAGPYMLIYTRAPADESEYGVEEDESLLWPAVLVDQVDKENDMLWAQADAGQGPSRGSPPTKYATPSSMEVNTSPSEPDKVLEYLSEKMDTT